MRLPLLFLLPVLLFHPGSSLRADAPPRDIRLNETTFDALSNHEISELGQTALDLQPKKWRHAETPHFIVHFRRATEARRAVREIEYTLWFAATALGAKPEAYAKKSHIYIFGDRREWTTFLHKSKTPSWSASFAMGDALFLHVGGPTEPFDSQLLAHETTHAVVARLYPQSRWPLWLNEGFAEYMGSASIAARKGQYLKGLQNRLQQADLPLDDLLTLVQYPAEADEITRLYQTSERLVRFLMTQFPKETFPKLVDAILSGASLETAVTTLYSEQVGDYAGFIKRYDRFEH
ncbi:MAG TPA: hypothetical protein VNQ90_17410 [Chthoniobacteraceae bacterium]|nr:hypothetical protein [Chthoniobacteraceae bacterium]